MTCDELVEEVTAYLEGAMTPAARDRLEAHCGTCPDCRRHVAQYLAMVGSLGHLEKDRRGPSSAEKERLLALFRERGLHHPGPRNPSIPLGLGSGLVAPGDHLVYLWETEQEFLAAAGFVAAGAIQGETSILLGRAESNERIAAAIQDIGLDVETLRREARLHFVAGVRSADALLEEIDDQIRTAVDRGAPLVRVLGNLGCGRPDSPEDRELLRLEAQVTDAIRKLPVVVACSYDVLSTPGSILLLGGLECHPLVCRRNILRTNDLYVSAGPFLAALTPATTPRTSTE